MSFLNPVNEPVLRFKSTDAGAPQINYNARTAGDVKAVLKACLVTGYGSVASAGWSVVNEVDHVCEFVSPSAAMSDYRLGINDSTAASTTWYYQYQNVAANLAPEAVKKSINYIVKTSASNGWQLLVSARGFYFIEIFEHTIPRDITCRLTWFGQSKSMLQTSTGKNISFFNVGYTGVARSPHWLFDPSYSSYKFYNIEQHTSVVYSAANMLPFQYDQKQFGNALVDSFSPIYLGANKTIIAEHVGMLLHDFNNTDDLYTLMTTNVNGRSLLSVPVTTETENNAFLRSYTRRFAIYTDYWEY